MRWMSVVLAACVCLGASAKAATWQAAVEKAGGEVSDVEVEGKAIGSKITFKKLTDAGTVSLKGAKDVLELEILDASKVTMAGYQMLTNLPNLRRLVIVKGTFADRGLQHVAKIATLEELQLYETKVTDVGVAHLAKLTSLTELDLSASVLTAKSLEVIHGLPDLRYLILGKLKADEEQLLTLGDLKKLKHLTLVQAGVKKETTDKLQEKLPKCRIEY